MLKKEDNDLLTQTGPETPGGNLMRSYWQPVALSEELLSDGTPIPVRILGENLVLFRDDQGRPGLLDINCCHRGTDLSYGRVEDGGLRCVYHGWLYDISGNCLEQPGELKGSMYREKVKQKSYPCLEVGNIIFTYMGSGEPPALPNYEFLNVPEEHLHVTKLYHNCNYLQGNEGNLDPAHLSFLHGKFKEGEIDKKQTVKGSNTSKNSLFLKKKAPTIEIEQTDFGMRIYSIRPLEEDSNFVRITNFIYPNLTSFPGSVAPDGYSVNWHVPIDDTHHWKYVISFTRSKPLDKKKYWEENYKEIAKGYKSIRNKENRYLQDRSSLNQYFAGLGELFQSHDLCAVESQGEILDRTKEHLGYSDKALTMSRRLLLKAIRNVKESGDAPHVINSEEENNLEHILVISEIVTGNWKEHVKMKISKINNEASS